MNKEEIDSLSDDRILVALAFMYLASNYLKQPFETTLINGTGYSMEQITTLSENIDAILTSKTLNLKN